jgi:hypothetical protein
MIKTMTRFGVLLLSVFLLHSCGEEDDSTVVTLTQINSHSTADNYMQSIYAELAKQQLFADGFLFFPLLYSDDCKYTGTSNSGWKQASDFDFSPESSLLNNVFLDFYSINATLNFYFSQVDTVTHSTITDDVRLGLRAEGQALRAVLYFYLSNYWGEVPLITDGDEPTDSIQVVATQQELFEQIESDLLYAEEHIEKSSLNTGNQRISKWGVKALLARVYLYNGDWAKAQQYAEEVINESGITLENTVNAIYNVSSSENVWVLPEALDDVSLGIYFLQPFASGQHVVQPRGIDFFEAGDLRRDVALSQPGNTILKYDDVNGNSDPVYMIRLSELYLIAAEAAARASGDYETTADYLNTLRTRAGLADVAVTADNFEDLILAERRAELCYEGMHRWLDLKRTGRDEVVLAGLGYEVPRARLWPFPASFLEVFKSVEQNEGY